MCKACKRAGLSDFEIADMHDGEYEEREAARQRLADDIDLDEPCDGGCGATLRNCNCGDWE